MRMAWWFLLPSIPTGRSVSRRSLEKRAQARA
jgi:hypothetical protein